MVVDFLGELHQGGLGLARHIAPLSLCDLGN